MTNRFRWLLLFLFILLLSGCAHAISKDLRTKSDPTLTLGQVRKNPNAYKEKLVVWGGEIIDTVNQSDGTTQIEVFQKPLGWRGEPRDTVASEGRFLVIADKDLDPYIYRRGRKITVAGEIIGEKVKPLGEMEYRYPVLSGKQIYVWPLYYYYPYPYYYDDPWWGYPYWGWGWGVRYYYFPYHRYYHRR